MVNYNSCKAVPGLCLLLRLISIIFVALQITPSSGEEDEKDVEEFLRKYDQDYSKVFNKLMLADWDYYTNMTDENSDKSAKATLEEKHFQMNASEEAEKFQGRNLSSNFKRQLKKIRNPRLPQDDVKRLADVLAKMNDIYASEKVCISPTECLSLTKLTGILKSVDEPAERRKAIWLAWHDTVGAKFRPLYLEYGHLKNKMAVIRGFNNYGEEFRDIYGRVNFDEDLQIVYEGILPLYKQLHAYVRRRLSDHYGLEQGKYIPQHLLGDMWGRFWTHVYKISAPYPKRQLNNNVNELLEKQNYTVRKMFELADDFYTSMGLKPVPPTFYNLSMIEEPADREVSCHPTAWDFYDSKDFRINICGKVSYDDILTIHHEMGHVQYFMQYAEQPAVFRGGANEGFQEAIGELISMCVSTPKHLHQIGLSEEIQDDEETDLNYLFSKALAVIGSMPFHFLNDKWRWDIFKGIPEEKWNEEFWTLSKRLAGVEPPVSRNDSVIDGPTIFHVANDYDMARYFVRDVLRYQFAQTLCDAAGQTGPLNNCDFYGSKAAGDKLSAMMRLGSSLPWEDAMEVLTGERVMKSEPILRYFSKLQKWLEETNAKEGNVVGWD